VGLGIAIEAPWDGRATLSLSGRDGFRSHPPPPEEFDSSLEKQFAEKFGLVRNGWTLRREAEIVHEGQTAFIPDFVFRQKGGTELLRSWAYGRRSIWRKSKKPCGGSERS